MREALENSDFRELLLWLLQRRRRFRVTGMSMFPALKPGDDVLINPRAYWQEQPNAGDIVVVRHPYRRDVRLVKRVDSVLDDGRSFLIGDNPDESTDSRAFGRVKLERIVGRVTSRLA